MGFGLLILLGLGYLIYQQSQHSHHHEMMPPSPPHKSAIDILNERYARGEINRDEYHSMREELEH